MLASVTSLPQLARLEALEAQRCAGEAASAELSEQLAAARRDLAAAAQREAEQARQLEEAQRALEAKR